MLNAISGSLAPWSHRRISKVASRKDVLEAAPATYKAGNIVFPRTTLAALQPGDIGFQVQRAHRNFKQFWITVGGHWAAWARPVRTDPFIVHAFVVVKPHPNSLRLHTVDGAGDNYTGIDNVMMSFGAEKFRVVPGGRYVFFRANNPAMRQRILHVARNWAEPNMHNFGIRRAVASPFHSLCFDRRAKARSALLAEQARIQGAPRCPNGKVFKMSCSEFVTNVIACAAVEKWQDEQAPTQQNNQDPKSTVEGLYRGPLGSDFAVDAKGVHPPALERLLENPTFWQPVGYVTENG